VAPVVEEADDENEMDIQLELQQTLLAQYDPDQLAVSGPHRTMASVFKSSRKDDSANNDLSDESDFELRFISTLFLCF
jgi:hypothetical protein